MTKDRKNTEIPQAAVPEETERLTVQRKKNSNPVSGKTTGKRNRGTVLIVLGVLLIMGALSLTGYNLWDNERAGKASDQVLQAIDEQIGAINPTEPSTVPSFSADTSSAPSEEASTEPTEESAEEPSDVPSGTSDPDALHGLNIDGNEYIGTIEIPSLGIRLPVMKSWDYQRLKISPCLYSGSYLENNMVICGHNYQRHFSPIKWIGIGADVYFVTVDKVVYHYTVCNRETVPPTAIQTMIDNMNRAEDGSSAVEDWHLTLFTCNPGGQTRCAVRCIRAES